MRTSMAPSARALHRALRALAVPLPLALGACRADGITTQHLPHKVVGKISWSPVPGLVFIDVLPATKDPYMTVLKLQLDGPVKLYRGHGGLQ